MFKNFIALVAALCMLCTITGFAEDTSQEVSFSASCELSEENSAVTVLTLNTENAEEIICGDYAVIMLISPYDAENSGSFGIINYDLDGNSVDENYYIYYLNQVLLSELTDGEYIFNVPFDMVTSEMPAYIFIGSSNTDSRTETTLFEVTADWFNLTGDASTGSILLEFTSKSGDVYYSLNDSALADVPLIGASITTDGLFTYNNQPISLTTSNADYLVLYDIKNGVLKNFSEINLADISELNMIYSYREFSNLTKSIPVIETFLNNYYVNVSKYSSLGTDYWKNEANTQIINLKTTLDSYSKFYSGFQSELDAILNTLLLKKENSESSSDSTVSSGSGGKGGSTSISFSKVTDNSVVVPVVNEEEKSNDEYFSDLTDYPWATDAINSLFEKKIISGFDDGTFKPGDFITREQFVKMLVLAFEIESESTSASFSDVDTNEWSYPYIMAAAANEIVLGANGSFNGSNHITREEIAAMCYRALLHKNTAISPLKEKKFADSDTISSYARNAIDYLAERELMNGYEDGKFLPLANTTRAEVAALLHRIMERIGE